jgi:predicted enzyme related to lactoylglutathione lyase
MNPHKIVPLVTTGLLSEVKSFYTEHLGMKVNLEVEGYLSLVGPSGGEIAFMKPEEENWPNFGGQGLTICFEVDDVDAEARRLVEANLPVVTPLRDNPWGDRSIVLRDPVGIYVYVYREKSEAAKS